MLLFIYNRHKLKLVSCECDKDENFLFLIQTLSTSTFVLFLSRMVGLWGFHVDRIRLNHYFSLFFLRFMYRYGVETSACLFEWCKHLFFLLQERRSIHWKVRWMLQAISSRTGIPTKLTHAPGPMLTVILIIMWCPCKIFFYILLSFPLFQ